MKTPRFLKFTATQDQAESTARRLTAAHAQGDRQIFAVIEGPRDDWAVVDLMTAIESGQRYSWSA